MLFPEQLKGPSKEKNMHTALKCLAEREILKNVRPVFGSGGRGVLTEGIGYEGIWLECGPHESLTIAEEAPEAALMSHRIFYIHQRPDGQFPYAVKGDRAGYRQIQQVVPIACTALELAEILGDEAFLAESFDACSKWEAWLVRNRDPRKLDLIEAWCTYDTGHDHSPRFAGCPDFCPEGAGVMPRNVLPRLAPDLSANLYSSRLALAKMADRLGKSEAAARYRDAAERTRINVEKFCYDPETEFYFDRLPDGSFVRIVGDAGLRVLGEHLPARERAERIFRRHILDGETFWTPFPMPSIAANDPAFIRPAPENSWGGASQALTALRALRYFPHYGFGKELEHLMCRWLEAVDRASAFRQQIDPFSGIASTAERYTPALCIAIEFCRRLENPGLPG